MTCARNGQGLVIEKILNRRNTRAFARSILKKVTFVKLVAVDSLSSQQLRRYFDLIMSQLDEYVFVVVVLVDNHAVNR